MTRYTLYASPRKRRAPALAIEPGDLEVVVACARELGGGVLLDLDPERILSGRAPGWKTIELEVEPYRDMGRTAHCTPSTVERYLAALRAVAARVPAPSSAAWQRVEQALTAVERSRHGLYIYSPPG